MKKVEKIAGIYARALEDLKYAALAAQDEGVDAVSAAFVIREVEAAFSRANEL